MFKNNNVDPAKREDNKNVIRISDYYIRNCSEQECVTVSDEVLEYLISARREERAQRQRDYRHLAPFGLDEVYLAELCGISDKSAEECFFDDQISQKLHQALNEIDLIFRRRFYFYHVVGMTMEEIGKPEGVSHSAISKSLGKSAEQLRKLLMNKSDI